MGIILRNCKRKKTKLLATKLAKAVTVHPKLFHVEQFALTPPDSPARRDVFRETGAFGGGSRGIYAPESWIERRGL